GVGGTLGLGNTIVASNVALFGKGINQASPSPDISGNVGSFGHNLVGIIIPGSSTGLGAAGDQFSTTVPIDPQMLALRATGVATLTLAPRIGSPAIDKGTAAGLATDQRGLPRTVDLPFVANDA